MVKEHRTYKNVETKEVFFVYKKVTLVKDKKPGMIVVDIYSGQSFIQEENFLKDFKLLEPPTKTK